MAENKRPIFDWTALLQSFQKFTYRGPIGMLTLAVLGFAAIMAVIAYRTDDITVQIVVLTGAVVVAVAFLVAVVAIIKALGPYALLSGTQVVTYRKIEMASKHHPSIPIAMAPAISDPSPPLQMLEGPSAEQDN
jgi:hypothetical protein